MIINDNDDDDVLPDLPLMVLGKSRVPPRLKDLQRRMGPSYTQVHDAGGDIVDIVIVIVIVI